MKNRRDKVRENCKKKGKRGLVKEIIKVKEKINARGGNKSKRGAGGMNTHINFFFEQFISAGGG